MTSIVVRAVHEADFARLAALDYTYDTDRALALHRTGMPPELTFAWRWQASEPQMLVYGEYAVARLRSSVERADSFEEGELVGGVVCHTGRERCFYRRLDGV